MNTAPRLTLDALLEPFFGAETPKENWRIGTEAEKFGIFLADAQPIGFDGKAGVLAIFDALREQSGWQGAAEHPGGPVISLKRSNASITLEPGCQLELSGAPQNTVHQTRLEFEQHLEELRPISQTLGVAWLGLGFHPFARHGDLDWVPKSRYRIMREYLPTRGQHALDMMQRTATVQANYDYASEQDAMDKLRVALKLSPIVTAMFANSPWVEGKWSGFHSSRAHTWLAVDPDRAGILPFAWQEKQSYRSYVEWALDVPMFLLKRGEEIVANTGQTFRAFMQDGFRGHSPTMEDWQQHLNTLFPEVRLKNTLEVRGADGQNLDLTCALPALWKGILYDDTACREAEMLVESLTPDTAEAARLSIATHSLEATLAGRTLAEWAQALLDIAERGLARQGALNDDGNDERVHTAPLRDLLATGHSPASRLLAQLGSSCDVGTIVEHTKL